MNRNEGLDFLKLLACVGVIILHTTIYYYDISPIFSYLYYWGTFSIPIFFTANGLVLLKKDFSSIKESYRYILKKVFSICRIVFVWTTFYWLLQKTGGGEGDNLFKIVLKQFIQRGYFYHFWFFGALFLIYALFPWMSYLLQKHKLLYSCLFVSLFIISESMVIFNFQSSELPIQQSILQTFRLWTWLSYFMLGGLLSRIDIKRYILSDKVKYFLSLVLISFPLYCQYISQTVYETIYVEYHYDSLLVKIIVVLLFLWFMNEKSLLGRHVFGKFYDYTMGIYIIHLHIIEFIRKIIPELNVFTGLSLIILTLLVSLVIIWCLRRVSWFKSLIVL